MSTPVKIDMNGYRDPEARELARQAYLRQLEEDRAFNALTGGMGFPGTGAGGGGGGARQCGFRKEGGTYAEVPTSPYGKPLEHFLACPPVLIDADEYGLTNVGVKLIDMPEPCLTCGGGGQTVLTDRESRETSPSSLAPCSACKGLGLVPVAHVFDIVGGEYYPNVADFIEEARRMGISRRLELSGGAPTPCVPCGGMGELSGDNVPYAKAGTKYAPRTCPDCKGKGEIPGANQYARLSSRSRLILLHKRAGILNAGDFNADLVLHGSPDDRGRVLEVERLMRAGCPKHHPQHKIEPVPDAGGYLMPHVSPACSALWWHDIEGGKPFPERWESVAKFNGDAPDKAEELERFNREYAGRFVERKLAAGSYRGYSRPESFTPQYSLAIFGVFPLIRLAVIDPDGSYQDRVERAEAAGVPVDIEDS